MSRKPQAASLKPDAEIDAPLKLGTWDLGLAPRKVAP